MTWAVEQDLKTNEKMVLVMLANCSNHHTGQCNPSHKRLAKECGMSISTLKRCIDKLEEVGYLKIERRGQDGVSLPNQYDLKIGFTPDPKPEQVDSSSDNQVQSDHTPTQDELTPVQSEPTPPVQSELGVGSEGATNHEFNQEYNNQEYNYTDAEKSAPEAGESFVPAVLSKQQQVNPKETELQARCRVAWTMYKAAYTQRHEVPPVRNAKVNSQVKQLVQRLGDEAGPVAEFYVYNVNDAFIVKNYHDLGLLLSKAEVYRTQWATGRTMTQTRARQIDSTQANASAVDEALAIARARRNQGDTYEHQ